jgi:hypothetical protein
MAMVLELEATHAQIQRILQSKAFRTSEIHRTLLSYLAEKSLSGSADGLKEYTVGLDVFAKPDSYDPRQESTVRMHVARLRQKLGEYYRTEGINDSIMVDLPKGGFKLTFEPREVRPEPLVAPPVAVGRWGRKEIGLIAGLVIALSLAGYFGMRLRQVERSSAPPAREWTPELQQLWEPLVSSKRPLIVCLSTPSGLGENATATGGVLLGQFLGMLHKQDVLVTSSDQIAAPEVAMGNVVFLGPVAGKQMQAMSADRPFVLEANGIRNMSPAPGEPAIFADKPPHDPQDTEESYALISRVPGLYGNGEVLYLAGNRISSITGEVQAFTDATFAKTLIAKMKKPDGSIPRYYQVVLKVRSMDTMPIEVSYVLHRELKIPVTP